MLETMASGKRIVVNRGASRRWVLVPHVDPAPQPRVRDFYDEVLQLLDPRTRQRPTADRLAAALRDDRERGALRDCYERIISGRVPPAPQPHFHVAVPGPADLWRGRTVVDLRAHGPFPVPT